MKLVFASVLALSVVATPALAQMKTTPPSTGAKTTKTLVTKGPKSTATTTVTTKVTPNTGIGEKRETAAQEANERHHARHHHKARHHHAKKAAKTTSATKTQK